MAAFALNALHYVSVIANPDVIKCAYCHFIMLAS